MARKNRIELAVGYGLILAVCWTAEPAQKWLFWVAAAWFAGVIAFRLAHRDRAHRLYSQPIWKEMGLGIKGSVRSLWALGAAAGLSALTLWVAGRLRVLHPLHGTEPVWSHLLGYLFWALAQEFILQDFFLVSLLAVVSTRKRAVIIASLLFASAHLPNPLLAPLTVLWGWIACWLFLRYRGLFTLGLIHGLLGLTLAIAVPNSVHHHMRVGLGYIRYHPHSAAAMGRAHSPQQE